ncbi:hypothetical protein ACFKKE_00815, partial [Streptococcus agalactiae]
NYGKVPYSINGYRASTTNKKTWCDFESVSIEYEVDEQYSGIGFVLSDDNNFVCLDIDNAIDEKGQINSELALKMMQLTYCEKSPSGTGDFSQYVSCIIFNANSELICPFSS